MAADQGGRHLAEDHRLGEGLRADRRPWGCAPAGDAVAQPPSAVSAASRAGAAAGHGRGSSGRPFRGRGTAGPVARKAVTNGVGAARATKVGERSPLDDAAVAHQHDHVGEVRRLADVVGDHHDRLAERAEDRRADHRAARRAPAGRARRAARRAATRPGSSNSARMMATRWRWPPDSSVGKARRGASAGKRVSAAQLVERGAAMRAASQPQVAGHQRDVVGAR